MWRVVLLPISATIGAAQYISTIYAHLSIDRMVNAVAVFKLNATMATAGQHAPASPPVNTMPSSHVFKNAGMPSKAPIKPSKSQGKLTATTVASKSTSSTSTAQQSPVNNGSSNDDWESF